MPQLDFATYFSQIFWLAVGFTILYIVMARYAIPQISSTIEGRAERINADVTAAKNIKLEADELGDLNLRNLEMAKGNARDVITAEKAKADDIAKQALDALEKDIAVKNKTASTSIEKAKNAAVKKVEAEAEKLANEIFAKVTSTSGKKVKEAKAA